MLKESYSIVSYERCKSWAAHKFLGCTARPVEVVAGIRISIPRNDNRLCSRHAILLVCCGTAHLLLGHLPQGWHNGLHRIVTMQYHLPWNPSHENTPLHLDPGIHPPQRCKRRHAPNVPLYGSSAHLYTRDIARPAGCIRQYYNPGQTNTPYSDRTPHRSPGLHQRMLFFSQPAWSCGILS